ncbi:MAG: three-Cys-motif partner protein TcmP [Chloroflexi bacterium]|nr:three-Cys-motif partner protein TcmP [Chloroflexota bacterium]
MPRDVGEWTKDKLKIVSQYLPVYLEATVSAIERVYVDAFAGPGANRVERTGEIIDGSPLIALSAKGNKGARGFDRLIFIEKDYGLAMELKTEVERRGEGKRASVILGDVNTELPELMRQIHPKSPTFVFLDTEGIEPSWETIQSLAAWRTELLINFPLGMSINRNADSVKTEAYFGTPEWREYWNGGRLSRTSGLIRFYLDRLAALGWNEQPDLSRLVKGDGNKHLYYLLFASKNPAGGRIMNWAFSQPDATGQGRLAL